MRIKIEYTVEVDPQEWARYYGIDLADVREDVKSLLMHAGGTYADSIGLFK